MSTAALPGVVQAPHPGALGVTTAAGREIVFPEGLPGFAGRRTFRLQPEPAAAGRFLRLQATGADGVAFLVVPVAPGPATLAAADIEEVIRERAIARDDLLLLAVVAARPVGATIEASVNLRAPIFVDVGRALAWQVVLRNPSYPLRLPLNRAA